MVIKTEEEYENSLKELEAIFDSKEGTPEFEKCEELAEAILNYEDIYYSI